MGNTPLKVMRAGPILLPDMRCLVRREIHKLVMSLVLMAKQYLWMQICACANTRIGRPLCDDVGMSGVPEPSAGREVE